MRRTDPLVSICLPVRNGDQSILHEDEVFATKLALCGPWGHVPEEQTQTGSSR